MLSTTEMVNSNCQCGKDYHPEMRELRLTMSVLLIILFSNEKIKTNHVNTSKISFSSERVNSRKDYHLAIF